MTIRSMINLLPMLLPITLYVFGLMEPDARFGWQSQVGAGFAIFFILYASVMLLTGRLRAASYLLMVPTVLLACGALYSVDYIPQYGIGASVFMLIPLPALWLSYWLFSRQVEPLAAQEES